MEQHRANTAGGGKFGRKPKLERQQIEQGDDRQKVADLFKVSGKTLYRVLANR